MRKTKRNWTAAVCVLTAALSTTPVFAAKEKEGSTSKANTESISTDASAKDNGERTIIDHAGNEVTLPEEINGMEEIQTEDAQMPMNMELLRNPHRIREIPKSRSELRGQKQGDRDTGRLED